MHCQPDRGRQTCEFDEVQRHELDLIAKRREEAFRKTSSKPTESAPAIDRPAENLTGLSLSGGGVRSAAFNLGLLQALYKQNVLPQIDYMSTVSGGGYTGAHLSSLAMHPKSQLQWQANATSGKASDSTASSASPHSTASQSNENPVNETLNCGEQGIHAPAVGLIARNCRYLTQLSHFLNRQLIGALCLNVVTLAGLVMFVSLAAWAFRALDHQPVMWFLDSLKIRTDIGRALLPALLFFVMWLVTWGLAFFRDRDNAKGTVAKLFLALWIGALFMGFAALAGNGDVALGPNQYAQRSANYSEKLTSIFKSIGFAGLVAILGGLLPYLNPRALMRSATVNRRGVNGMIYRAATTAMLFGVPLIMFWYMSSEDIAGSNQSRKDYILPDDTVRSKERLEAKVLPGSVAEKTDADGDFAKKWGIDQQDLEYQTRHDLHLISIPNHDVFWRLVTTSAVADDNNFPLRSAQKIPKQIAAKLLAARQGGIERFKGIDPQSEFQIFESELESESVVSHAFSCLRYLLGDSGTQFENQLKRKENQARGNEAIAYEINLAVLADASFYRALKVVTPSSLDDALSQKKAWVKDDEVSRLRELLLTAMSLETDTRECWRSAANQWSGKVAESKLAEDFSGSLTVEELLKYLETQVPQQLPVAARTEWQTTILRLVKLGESIRKNNRAILEHYCGDFIKPSGSIFATIVQPEDQKVRGRWAWMAAAIFVIAGAMISLNAISLLGVYRDALSQAWIVDPTDKHGSTLNLHELSQVTARGWPYHLITGATNIRSSGGDTTTQTPFLFSPLYCGCDDAGYVNSARYASGRLTLSDAMAISGAAVAPLQIQDLLGRILLILANLRMGTWLPNPFNEWWHRRPLDLPTIPRLLWNLWVRYPQTAGRVILQWIVWRRCCDNRKTPFLYVSDGGHFENLGIGELLKRRCRVIIASDAAEDSGYRFEDFIKTTTHALKIHVRIQPLDESLRDRTQDGVSQIRRMLRRLRPDAETQWSERHFVVMQIDYLDDPAVPNLPKTGYLIYIKPNLTGDEAFGLQGFKSLNPEFPNDPTSNQLFEDDKFEAYRQLGYHSGEQLVKDLHGPSIDSYWLSAWSPPSKSEPQNPPQKTAAPTAESQAISQLCQIVQDSGSDELARSYAIRDLAAYSHVKQAFDALSGLVIDNDPEIALRAVQSLTFACDPHPLLIRALSSRYQLVRAEALSLIRCIKPEGLRTSVADLLERLGDVLNRKYQKSSRPSGFTMQLDAVFVLKELLSSSDSSAQKRADSLLRQVSEDRRLHPRVRNAASAAFK